MDWITWLAVGFALLWIFCFIDGNAVLELRLFFHDLSQATSHLYLALLPLRRAASHFTKCVRHLVWHPQQSSSQYQDRPMANESMLHLLEGLCVVYETLPNLMGAALSVCTAFCHILQGGFYIMAATLRTVRNDLFSQENGEKERWDKERLRAKEREKSEFQRAGVNVLSAPCKCFKNQS